MADMATVGSYIDYVSELSGSIVKCCFCGLSQPDLLMLSCLHNCCRSCLESVSGTMSVTAKSSSSVTCGNCREVTEYNAVTSNGLLRNYRRLAALHAESACCSKCDAQGVAAAAVEFWCADCCAGLCGSCYSAHNSVCYLHRSAELDVARTWSLSQLTSAARCSLHEQLVDGLCFTCRAPKCQVCIGSCLAAKHVLRPLSHDETQKHTSAVIEAIGANIVLLSRAVSRIQRKCKDTTSRLQGTYRMAAHRLLVSHRRSLNDAVANAFDEAVRDVGGILPRTQVICAGVAAKVSMPNDATATVARKVQSLSVWRLISKHPRHQGFLLNTVCCILSLFEALRRQPLKRCEEVGAFSIEGSVPLTVDITLGACFGATALRRDAPPAPLLFTQDPVTFRTPFGCSDVAVTQDGHVLLAAREHGLLVYVSLHDRWQQLSSWRPARRTNGRDDAVSSVAALSCGRAAAGVFWAQLVVLLKRNQTGDTWLEDRRVAVLQSPPKYLAVCGDLLAATEYRHDEQTLQWLWSRHVQLMRLSSGQVLYEQSRDYDIYTIALTALCVVTTSRQSVRLDSGATPYVVDAFSHSGAFLWRYKTSDEEGILGLCATETWRTLYVIVAKRNDWMSSIVTAISAADGRDRGDVLSSVTHGLQLPEYVSLGRGQRSTILAVLSFDQATRKFRTVTLYEAT